MGREKGNAENKTFLIRYTSLINLTYILYGESQGPSMDSKGALREHQGTLSKKMKIDLK